MREEAETAFGPQCSSDAGKEKAKEGGLGRRTSDGTAALRVSHGADEDYSSRSCPLEKSRIGGPQAWPALILRHGRSRAGRKRDFDAKARWAA